MQRSSTFSSLTPFPLFLLLAPPSPTELAPDDIPSVLLEQGKWEEMQGKTEEALKMYRSVLERAEKNLNKLFIPEESSKITAGGGTSSSESAGSWSSSGLAHLATLSAASFTQTATQLHTAAKGGIIRCMLRMGDVRSGTAMALETKVRP